MTFLTVYYDFQLPAFRFLTFLRPYLPVNFEELRPHAILWALSPPALCKLDEG